MTFWGVWWFAQAILYSFSPALVLLGYFQAVIVAGIARERGRVVTRSPLKDAVEDRVGMFHGFPHGGGAVFFQAHKLDLERSGVPRVHGDAHKTVEG